MIGALLILGCKISFHMQDSAVAAFVSEVLAYNTFPSFFGHDLVDHLVWRKFRGDDGYSKTPPLFSVNNEISL